VKRKLYACGNCGYKVPILSKGFCAGCRAKQRPQKHKQIKRTAVKRSPSFKKTSPNLKKYFDTQLERLMENPYSEESDKFISSPSKVNLAHHLPKRPNGGFPSIADDLDNCIFLTLEEHSRFDQLLDQRKFKILEKEYPKTWNLEKLVVLLNRVTERNKFYFQLVEYINQK